MSDITIKTTAELIDQLITASLRCYMAQEDMAWMEDEEGFNRAARTAQSQNARRTELIRALEERLDKIVSTPMKSYG